jgi:hypothetical protein
MSSIENISKELFSILRARFSPIEMGDEQGMATSDPEQGRFFIFSFSHNNKKIGKITINLGDDGVSIIYSKDLLDNQSDETKQSWFEFIKNLRFFSKKKMIGFDVRDITKPYLTKKDIKFLSKNKDENMMAESKLYGTPKTSFQKIGSAKLIINHSKHIDEERVGERSRNIGSIYIESEGRERFKYPYRHLSGARAMAVHVSEGGNVYDNFGKYIVGLSEETAKLRKFKRHVGRGGVMAETLTTYVDTVNDRIVDLTNTIKKLQNVTFYKEHFDNFEESIFEEVPEDVSTTWIDELTIRQFNEELKDVFPYLYKLISEKNKPEVMTPDDFEDDYEKDHGDKNFTSKCSMSGKLASMVDDITQKYDHPVKKPLDKLQLSDYIVSYYDKESKSFPKGETAILTKIEKEYGDRYIEPSKQFINKLKNMGK